MPATRLWLPPAAPKDAEAAVSAMIEVWAADWFANASRPIVRRSTPGAQSRLTWQGGEGAMLGVSDATSTRMGRAICGNRGSDTNPLDRVILAGIGEEALADLVKLVGIAELTPIQRDAQVMPRWVHSSYAISSPDRAWSIVFAISEGRLNILRSRKAARDYTPELGTFAKALADEPCNIGLSLGWAQLSAFDLATLECGDVIVLDTAVNDAVPLTIEGYPTGAGSARIEHAADGYQVAIATPISAQRNEAIQR